MSFDSDLREFENNMMCDGHSVCLVSQSIVSENIFISHELKDGIRQIYWFIAMVKYGDKYRFRSFDIRDLTAHCQKKLPDSILTAKQKIKVANRLFKKIISEFCDDDNSVLDLIDTAGAYFICGEAK